ncbi:phage replication initiation protein [Clostridium sporogenes]|uniref:phage replication initiation protein n=1 Tax=Clostridium sporogenes TaxID=1509 RepID=UPI003F90D3FB
MFSLSIIDTDLFLDMPLSTQALYFHLSMRADDDGFIGNPKKIQRMIGSSEDDMKVLITKQFIIPFESGVCVIKHWRVHNYIQTDRYHSTFYKLEKSMLEENNNTYDLLMDTNCIQNGSNMDTQVRLGKDRLEIELGKDSIEVEKKKGRKKTYNTIIDEYTNNEELKNTILEFIKMRTMIKSKMTDNALNLMLNKLDKLTNDDDMKIKILEQSIMNSWKGVFPLKQESIKQNSSNTDSSNVFLDMLNGGV